MWGRSLRALELSRFFFFSFLFPSVVPQPIVTVIVVTAANHRSGESDGITWGRRAFVSRLWTSREKNSASQIFIVYLFLKRINVHRIQKTQRGKIYFLLFQLNMLNVSSVLKTGLGVNHNAIDDDIKFSSVFLCCRRNTVTPRIW